MACQTKATAALFALILLGLLVLGCTGQPQTPPGTGDGDAGTAGGSGDAGGDAAANAEDQSAVDDYVDGEIVDESFEPDLGEVI